MASPSSLPLADITVVDFSNRLAGAYCCKLLSDAGARVVKVEPPKGDPLRRWSTTRSVGTDGQADGALFRFVCANMRSVVVDFDDPESAARGRKLASSADIVVETWLPGVAETRGIGIDDLHRRNPAVVVASISAFGRGGPDSERDLPEFLLQARSGSSWDHGLPDREPLAVPCLLGEWGAGAFAAFGAMAGLYRAMQTGRGRHVDTSILESLALTHSPAPVLMSKLKGVPAEREARVPVPGNEPSKDGWVGFYALTAQQWQDFAAMVGDEALLADQELDNLLVRMGMVAELRVPIRKWTRERTTSDILEQSELFRVPAAPITNGATVTEVDHVRARGIYVENPSGGIRHPRPAFRWGDHADRILEPAPAIGNDHDLLDVEGPDASLPPTTAPDDLGLQPLAGVRVLDLTAFWAGPFATDLLVAMGADVIKVESIQRPDMMRFGSFAPMTDPLWYEQGHMFNTVNLGKRGLTVDLGNPVGRDLLLRMVASADVVFENFTPRVLDNFDLGYEVLREVRPDVIMLRAPAFGLDGPWRDRPGFAVTIEQAAGLAWMTGYEGGEPLAAGGPFDPIMSAHAAFAIIAALHHRDRTGEGQLIEVPMLDMALAATSEAVLELDAYGHLLDRVGNRSLAVAPQGIYPSADEGTWVALSIQTDDQWPALAALLGRDDWLDAEELRDVQGRVVAHAELDDGLARWAAARTAEQSVTELTAMGVPATSVIPSHCIDDDPQLRARGFWQTVEHPALGVREYTGLPFPTTGPWFIAPSPLLGEHNEELLSALGLSPEEIEGLRAEKIIGNRPLGL